MGNLRPNSFAWIGIVFALGTGLISVVVVPLGASMPGGAYGMMGTGGWGWGLAMMAVSSILLVLIFIFAFVDWGEGSSAHFAPAPPQTEGSAVDILNHRYARGEITREQFIRMRADLEAQGL